MSIMRNLLNIVLIISVCLIWACTEGAKEKESKDVHFHTIPLSSLFPSPSSSCVLSSKASNTKSSLHVVHRHGPCSSLSNGKAVSSLDHDEILKGDQARVDSIHSKLSKSFTDLSVKPSQSTDLPAKDGSTLGAGNYIVTIGIGTPKHDQSLVFDTGSDLTWIQCGPCARSSCYPQKEPIFNPSSSSSYSNVSCPSPVRSSLGSRGIGRPFSVSNSDCFYELIYGDYSSTMGFLAKEKFTLTTSDVFDGVTFGCGKINRGRFFGIAGLLGLGRGSLSFPSQTASIYKNIFSYCLPSSASYTGHLTFGSAGISRSVKFTPISSSSSLRNSFYGIDIVGITVGDQKLEIPLTVFSTPGAIIDSGTVITRLPPKAYAALRTAFKDQMSNYTATAGPPLLDTCYDFTGVETLSFPQISFSFNGGTVVDLDFNGIFLPFNRSQVCLAFAGNNNDRNKAIFGNIQQKRLQIVYDNAGGRVGFAPNGCD